MVRNSPMRVSPEMKKLVNFIRAKYILDGKTPPSCTRITKMIANKVKKEDLLRNEFIRF